MGFLGAGIFSLVLRPSPQGSASPKPGSELKATSIEIVGAQGQTLIKLGASKEGPPGIWMMDANGVSRVILGIYPDNTGYIGLQDKNNLMVQLMRSFGPEESPLHIFKSKGADRMITGLNPGAGQAPFLMHYSADQERKLLFGTYEGP